MSIWDDDVALMFEGFDSVEVRCGAESCRGFLDATEVEERMRGYPGEESHSRDVSSHILKIPTAGMPAFRALSSHDGVTITIDGDRYAVRGSPRRLDDGRVLGLYVEPQ